ncbi:MAG TPA: hypothetical protein PKB01_02450 [Xanthobacteraceae bacterium]|nr:hypothetical protein [Xanthobacteraceae bacterium]
MKRLVVVLALLFASDPAFAQRQCRDGEKVTVTVKMNSAVQHRDDLWRYVALGGSPCTVGEITGKGKTPESCVNGATMEAKGTIRPHPTFIILDADEVRCF